MSQLSDRRIRLSLLLVVCALLACKRQDDQPMPFRGLMTSGEMTAALNDTSEAVRYFASLELVNLWSGRLGLLKEAAWSEDETIRVPAFMALAKIGSDSSLTVLREICGDSSLPLMIRCFAAMALGSAADKEAIPILKELLVVAKEDSYVRGEYVERAILQAQCPDSRRPLVQLVNHRVAYRFLLDDVTSIEFRKNTGLFLIGGQVAGYHGPNHGKVYEIPRNEYRKLLELLDDGTELIKFGNIMGEIVESDYLVITLTGGRNFALLRSGDRFLYRDEWGWLTDDFTIQAPALAKYLDSRT